MALIDEILLTDIAHKKDLLETPSGDLDIISGKNNLKEALFRRLITEPGSIIHRPEYGIGTKQFQNAANSVANQRVLAQRIIDQFPLDPRVKEVTGVRMEFEDDNPEKVVLFVRIVITGLEEVEVSFIPFGE